MARTAEQEAAINAAYDELMPTFQEVAQKIGVYYQAVGETGHTCGVANNYGLIHIPA